MSYEKVQLDLVVDAKENRVLEDITGLAKSIQENGLLVAPLLRTIGDGQYEIVAGHRRIAALRKLGETQVMAHVNRELHDQDAAMLQLVENLQRQELDPLDEARAVARIIGLGMSIKELAVKAGRSQTVIRSRLRLLELPEQFYEDLRAGGLDLGDAEALAKANVSEAVKVEAYRIVQEDGYEVDRALEMAQVEATLKADAAAMAAELDQRGIPVWDTLNSDTEDPPEGFENFLYVTDQDYQASNIDHYLYLGPDSKKEHHAKVTCTGYILGRQWKAIEKQLVCLKPERHEKDGESKLKRLKRLPTNRLSDDEKKQRAESKDARVARYQFITDNIQAPAKKADVLAAVTEWAEDQWRNGDEAVKLADQWLGLEVIKRDGYMYDYAGALREFAQVNDRNRAKAWTAYLWADKETRSMNGARLIRYYGLLQFSGYELTPGDKRDLKQAEEQVMYFQKQQAERDKEEARNVEKAEAKEQGKTLKQLREERAGAEG